MLAGLKGLPTSLEMHEVNFQRLKSDISDLVESGSDGGAGEESSDGISWLHGQGPAQHTPAL